MITLPERGPGMEALLDHLELALDAEREALLSGDEDRLARAEREKAALMDRLAKMRDDGAPAANARLRDLAGKNRLNGVLIAERLGDVQRRRQFFEHLAGRASIYGPDGVTRPA